MRSKPLIITLSAVLLISLGVNVYLIFFYSDFDSYLQLTDEVYVMEAGILKNNLEFAEGEYREFGYDFENDEYPILLEKYKLADIAGNGTDLEKALNLMNEFSPRLDHKSDYDNHVDMNALSLLEYSLDYSSHGINCRAKAQILNEMCLALGVYARKVWINPYSPYDGDCHVVNEIWEPTLEKWVMLDITNNEYWVDENAEPLSILEIREKAANNEFCAPVSPKDKLNDLEKLKEKNIGDFLYITKNLVYTQYLANYSTGEDDTVYMLRPKNLDTNYELFISEEAVKASPIK